MLMKKENRSLDYMLLVRIIMMNELILWLKNFGTGAETTDFWDGGN